MRRAHKTDANQAAIVRALRQVPGVTVWVTSSYGGGFPDLLVRCVRGGAATTLALEVKDGAKTASGRALTGPETRFHHAFPELVRVVTSAAEALALVGVHT